jgi:hypothetical protein
VRRLILLLAVLGAAVAVAGCASVYNLPANQPPLTAAAVRDVGRLEPIPEEDDLIALSFSGGAKPLKCAPMHSLRLKQVGTPAQHHPNFSRLVDPALRSPLRSDRVQFDPVVGLTPDSGLGAPRVRAAKTSGEVGNLETNPV